MKQICITFILFILSGALMAESKVDKENRLKNGALSSLEKAKEWVITDIIKYHYSRDNAQESIVNELQKKFGVGRYTMSYFIDQNEALLDITITTRGIYYPIRCYKREKYNNKYYEFWVINVYGREWAGVNPHAEFYVTQAEDLHGERTILTRDDQFIGNFSIDDEFIFFFPMDNWSLLNLEAWNYPLNYINSDLNETFIWASGRVENKEDPFDVKDIIWDSRSLSKKELDLMEHEQLNGDALNSPGGFTFPSEK